MREQYYVYVLTNYRNTVFYIGITSNLPKRIWEHKGKFVKGFTKKYNVWKLVYYDVFNDPKEAIEREKQIKKWRRGKKMELVKSVNPKFEVIKMV